MGATGLLATQELALERFAAMPAVNYLHRGDAPEILLQRDGSARSSSRRSGQIDAGNARAVVGGRRRKVVPDRMRDAMFESLEWRKQFRALGCRGFSYEVDLQMRGYNAQHAKRYALGRDTNLRIALIARENLFYPDRVMDYLKSTNRYQSSYFKNHYHKRNMASIAFCLGKKKADAWYVLVMQSDPESNGPSYIRDHFRGWRNVLFANVVAQAAARVDRLYLCRAQDVTRTCFPGTMEAAGVPDRWRSIYDVTAAQWGMRLVRTANPVNIQFYRNQPPVFCDEFYELSLARAS